MGKNRIGIIFIIIGMLLTLYPLIGRIVNSKTQPTAILNYQEKVEELSQDEIEKQKQLAKEYNDKLVEADKIKANESNTKNEIDYLKTINLNNMIGYIKIPKINVNLPIYHSTNANVLETGVGHMENTSLPVGGKSTHAVLTAHSGMVRQEMFDHLEELEEGDKFYIYVLNDKLTYQVDQIKIVEPDDEKYIQIVDGEDYVTLVTCTPYGINTHRILVRGTRIENELDETDDNLIQKNDKIEDNNLENSENITNKNSEKSNIIIFIIIGIILLIIIILITKLFASFKVRGKHEK